MTFGLCNSPASFQRPILLDFLVSLMGEVYTGSRMDPWNVDYKTAWLMRLLMSTLETGSQSGQMSYELSQSSVDQA